MSSNALQAAIYDRLTNDAAVTAIAGPDRVFDRRLAQQKLPCLVIGQWRVTDWSTGDDTGEEHRFDIEIWSDDNGRKQAAVLADLVRAALHEAPLTLSEGHLVNLRHEKIRLRREARSGFHTALVGFRAVTE